MIKARTPGQDGAAQNRRICRNVCLMPKAPYKHDEAGTSFIEGVAQRIRWLREEVGWTQVQMAKAAGVDQSTWAKYENAERLAGVQHMARLSEKLGFSLDYIYRGRIGETMRRDLELRLAAAHPVLVLGQEGAKSPAKVTAPAV